MYNPIRFIKDVIDLVRTPPGKAICALEITHANRTTVIGAIGFENQKYAKIGDFLVEFETTVTVVPRKEFHKHYAFSEPAREDLTFMTPVRTIKPL